MKKKEIFKRKFFELNGSIHNHSEYSYDSDVPVEVIIKAARKAGLDYMTFNDHFNKDVQYDDYLKTVDDITVIVGTEIYDPQKNNHLLVFGSEKIHSNMSASDYLKKYKEEDTICFIAHPIEKRKPKPHRCYPWNAGFSSEIDGVEIWNFSSMWLDKVIPKFNGLLLTLFPVLAIRKPYKETIEFWEEFCDLTDKKVVAFGSSDAHGTVIRKLMINIPVLQHKQLMKVIRTNVLIEADNEINPSSILQALKNGNSYIANYSVGNPFDFYAGISDEKGNGIIPGEEMSFSLGMKLYFKLPKIAVVRLIRNGEKIAQQNEDKGFFKINKPGRYRLEITKFLRGWIYTNNFYII